MSDSDWDSPAMTSFANHIFPDWDMAMDAFFRAVERKMRARELSESAVRRALVVGYGDEIAEAWDEWIEADG